MAVEDLFYKLQLVNKQAVSTPEGWVYVYKIGAEFDGISIKKGISYQTQTALLGNDKTQYQLSTFVKNRPVLPIGQIYRWAEAGEYKYAIVKSPDNVSPSGSAIEDIQVFDAESFVMPSDAIID